MGVELSADAAGLSDRPGRADQRVVTLRGAVDEASFHDAIAAALGFPGYYGRNLDALYDCLTDQPPLALVWWDWPRVAVHHPHWWVRLLDVLTEWADRPGCRLVLPIAPETGTPRRAGRR